MYALAEWVCFCLMAAQTLAVPARSVKSDCTGWRTIWCIVCCSAHRDTAATATNIDRQHSGRTNVLVTYLWHSDGASLPLRAQKEGAFFTLTTSCTPHTPIRYTNNTRSHKTGWIKDRRSSLCVPTSLVERNSRPLEERMPFRVIFSDNV